MANIIYQPGDRVQVTTSGERASTSSLAKALQKAPVLTVERQMPYEPDHYMLSDDCIYNQLDLHLVGTQGE